MNIALIGYRGTGKSAVGRLLAGILQMPCVSMDAKIAEKAGMSIPEIVNRDGWPKFRDLESEVASELSALDNVIIDTGGGVIERLENIEILKNNALVIWLKASTETIISRIQYSAQRPSLTDGKSFTAEVAEVLEQRTPKYKEAADYEIDTDALTPQQVADIIIEIWNERHHPSVENH